MNEIYWSSYYEKIIFFNLELLRFAKKYLLKFFILFLQGDQRVQFR